MLQAGLTALCWASDEGHVEVVQVLLQYGASPNHRTKVFLMSIITFRELLYCCELLKYGACGSSHMQCMTILIATV